MPLEMFLYPGAHIFVGLNLDALEAPTVLDQSSLCNDLWNVLSSQALDGSVDLQVLPQRDPGPQKVLLRTVSHVVQWGVCLTGLCAVVAHQNLVVRRKACDLLAELVAASSEPCCEDCTCPAVGSVSPDNMCMTVLFPAPFGPSSPRTSPGKQHLAFQNNQEEDC